MNPAKIISRWDSIAIDFSSAVGADEPRLVGTASTMTSTRRMRSQEDISFDAIQSALWSRLS
jgi:hypothetical protein